MIKDTSALRARGDWLSVMATTAAPRAVPEQLVAQLRVGGRLVIPVGDDRKQQLSVVTRTESGFEVREVEPARFVPLLSGMVR